MLIKQVCDLRKVRSENLIFTTDLQERDVTGWSISQ